MIGKSYLVSVFRQPGGTVTTPDGRINCGTAPSATLCGPVSFNWTDTATLIATPDAGQMFGGWAGSCSGRLVVNGQYVCYLDTKANRADKYAVPVFGPDGQADHPNFSDPAYHAAEFWKAIELVGDPPQHQAGYFDCKYCHGSNYQGVGYAPSCTDCHAKTGFPNFLADCDFCHAAPPAAPHPTVLNNDIRYCWGCHQNTVDSSGNIIPGGDHMNGLVNATGGHKDGYGDPAIHGRDFFEFISGTGGLDCTGCHAPDYGKLIASGDSCNSCHRKAGWVGNTGTIVDGAWQSNCSFCHGVKDPATTQAAPYDVAAHPVWSAPPQSIAQRLDPTHAATPAQTGAHTAHLTAGKYAGAFACGVCHEVPTTLTHISGKAARAAVVLMAPGQTSPDPTGYNVTAGTCATSCHGTKGSPAWSSTGLACDGCHNVPPQTAAHAGLSGSDLTLCSGCHPTTIDTTGAIIPDGTHVNGAVDKVSGHTAGFAAPSVHGPQFLNYVAAVQGTQNCTACHGSSLGYCTNCHSQPASGGWQNWQTNCTFCHGARTPAYTAANLKASGPPDDIAQRLAGGSPTVVPNPTRTGKHSGHLAGGTVSGTAYPAVPCATCHPVPQDVNHISASRRAAVALNLGAMFPNLSADEVAKLPNSNPTVFYDPATNRCNAYCHGSAAWGGAPPTGSTPTDRIKGTAGYNPLWSTGAATASCESCHGQPPPTGKIVPANGYCLIDLYPTGCSLHEWHSYYNSANNLDGCTGCHYGYAHLNGVVDVAFMPNPPNGQTVTGSYDKATGTCNVSCHAGGATWRQ